MKRASKSRNWRQRQNSDPYVRAARQDNLRARSAYKLQEIDNKHNILRPAQTIIDLGSAPGSWSQLARQSNSSAKIIACDLLPMVAITGVQFIQGDFRSSEVQAQLVAALGQRRADLIISDMAPDITGIAAADAAAAEQLLQQTLEFARQWLKPQATLLYKYFQGPGFSELVPQLRQSYATIKLCKPAASRSQSSELYLLLRQVK